MTLKSQLKKLKKKPPLDIKFGTLKILWKWLAFRGTLRPLKEDYLLPLFLL